MGLMLRGADNDKVRWSALAFHLISCWRIPLIPLEMDVH